MHCPHCQKEIEGKTCPECSQTVPQESRFCMFCGVSLDETRIESDIEEDPFDFDNRILCPDGTCTGIIVEGKCTECGKSFQGDQIEEA